MGQSANVLDKLAIRRNRSNYATAKSIMAHSEMMRRELIELYGVPPEKVRTIHPPADTVRFFPSRKKSPPPANATAGVTMKPCSCSHPPATNAKA